MSEIEQPKPTDKESEPVDEFSVDPEQEFYERALTEEEETLFKKTLGVNKHLGVTQYPLLRVWCKLAIKLEGMKTDREFLRFAGELRLLSNSLKLLPDRKQDKDVDLATLLAENGHSEI